MSNKFHIHYTDLICLNCGNINTIQRIQGRERELGHIKDLYCYVCESRQKHYEIKDVDLFRLKYEDYVPKKLNENTTTVLNIIREREINEGRGVKLLKKVPSKR